MPTIIAPTTGIVGLPTGTKDRPRADFLVSEIEKFLEQKGYRVGWSRACLCPCQPVNDQTEQADPNCTLCSGTGWFHFRAADYAINTDLVGDLDTEQESVLDRYQAVVIKGIMTGLAAVVQPNDKISRWVEGTSVITVRAENKLGYHDRIIGLDSRLVYSEFLDVTAATTTLLPARYPVLGVNLLRSSDQIYEPGLDFVITDGSVEWLPGGTNPVAGTRLAIHYLTFPVWLVVEYPKAVRDTVVKFKTTTPKMPLGDPTALPMQAVVKYEFLP